MFNIPIHSREALRNAGTRRESVGTRIFSYYGKWAAQLRARTHMVSSKDLGSQEQRICRYRSKKILARLAAILAILLIFSARGTKINNIEKSLMTKHIF